jgi:hypothetical protein
VSVLLYVEGATEESALPDFFGRWLRKNGSDLQIRVVNFEGARNYLKTFAKRAKRDLGSGRVRGIVGLIDLYGSRLSFPNGLVPEKYSWAKSELEQKVGDSRFHQHSQYTKPKRGSSAVTTCFRRRLM